MRQRNNSLQTIYRIQNNRSGEFIEVAPDPCAPGHITIKGTLLNKPVILSITEEQAKLMIVAFKQILTAPTDN